MICAVWLAAGCAQEQSPTESTAPPPAVHPVEVTPTTTPTPPADDQEVTQLRARVAELEQQLATCRSGPQTAPIPTGVDPPATTPQEATTAQPVTPQPTTPPAGQQTASNTEHPRTQPRDQNIIQEILGPDGRPRQRRDGTIVLPNPANILLGEGRNARAPQQQTQQP